VSQMSMVCVYLSPFLTAVHVRVCQLFVGQHATRHPPMPPKRQAASAAAVSSSSDSEEMSDDDPCMSEAISHQEALLSTSRSRRCERILLLLMFCLIGLDWDDSEGDLLRNVFGDSLTCVEFKKRLL
jgi:hypothetical protein